MNHSLSPSATRLNLQQDFADAGDELPMPIMWEGIGIEVFKVHESSPRAHILGLPAAVSLLNQSKCPSYDMFKAIDPRICTAKLVQAFIACPRIHSGTCGAAKTCSEQMEAFIQQEPEPVEKSSLVLMLCAQLLHETTHKQHGTEKHMVKWLRSFHNRICLGTLLQKHCVSLLNKGLKDITSGLAAYGLQYQDLEWFSRAAMVSAVLKEYKQADKGMSTELTSNITRHVKRMIALAPDNPAGYEMMSYVLMKNTSTLQEAAMNMRKAMSAARANGDDTGLVQYALQCMYFMLWMHSMKPDSVVQRAELKQEIQPLLEAAQLAETHSGLHARSTDSGDADSSSMRSNSSSGCAEHAHVPTKTTRSWQSLARRRLQSGKLKLKQLALSMPEEMPCDLLDYLNICLSPSPNIVDNQTQASLSQLDQQTAAAANSGDETHSVNAISSLPPARPAEAAACAKSATHGSKPEHVSSLSTQSTVLEASKLTGKCLSPLMLRLRSYRSTSRSSMDSGDRNAPKGPLPHQGSSGKALQEGSSGSALHKGSCGDTVKSMPGPRAAHCSLHDQCAVSNDDAVKGISAHAPRSKDSFSAAMASARDRKAVAEPDSSTGSSSMHGAVNKVKTSDTLTKPIVQLRGKSAEAAADASCSHATGAVKLSYEGLTAADAAAAAALQGIVMPVLLFAKAENSPAASPAASPTAVAAAITSAATASAETEASAPVIAKHPPANPSAASIAAALQSSVTTVPKQPAPPLQRLPKCRAEVPQNLAGVPEPVPEPSWGVQLAASQQTVSAGRTSSATTAAAQATAEPGVSIPKGPAQWEVLANRRLLSSGQATAVTQAGCSTAPQASVAQKLPPRLPSTDNTQMAAQAPHTQAPTQQLSACRESASDAPPTKVAQAAGLAVCQATDAAAAAGNACVSASVSDKHEACAQTDSSDKRPAPDAPANAAKSLDARTSAPSLPPRALPSACAASPTAATASTVTASAAASSTTHSAAKAAPAISPALRKASDWSEAQAAVTPVSHTMASDMSYQQEHASKALDMLHALSSASEASTPLAAAAAAAAQLSEQLIPITQALSSSLPFIAGITGNSPDGFQQSSMHAAPKRKSRASKFDFRAAAMVASRSTSKASASASAKAFPTASATTNVPSWEAVQAAAAAASAACISSVTPQDKSSVSSASLALPPASEAIAGAADTPRLEPCSSAATQAAPQSLPQPSDAPCQSPQSAPLSVPLLQPQPTSPPYHLPAIQAAAQPSAASPKNAQTPSLPKQATEASLPSPRPVASTEQADKGLKASITPAEPSMNSLACGSCSATAAAPMTPAEPSITSPTSGSTATAAAKQATSLCRAPAHTATFEAAKASRFDCAKAVTKAAKKTKAFPAAQGTASLPRAAAQKTMPPETAAFHKAWEAVKNLMTRSMSATETGPEVAAAPTNERAKVEAKLDTARTTSVMAGLEALKRAHQAVDLECCSRGMLSQLNADFDSILQPVDNLWDMENNSARAEDRVAAYQKAQATFQTIRLL